MTKTTGGNICPFKLDMKRDNLFERMHGLPKMTKEEMKAQRDKYLKNVSHREFLPNSCVRSPSKKLHSHTTKTVQLGLYPMTRILPEELI